MRGTHYAPPPSPLTEMEQNLWQTANRLERATWDAFIKRGIPGQLTVWLSPDMQVAVGDTADLSWTSWLKIGVGDTREQTKRKFYEALRQLPNWQKLKI